MIVIVDYGMGNLRSVSKALESLGASVRVSSDPRDVAQAAKLILPGVGAFPAAMRELTARGLTDPLKASVAKGIPYLGICLGLQLLFESSEEGGGAAGLGVLPGVVKRFACHSTLKIPHMGWNQIVRHQTLDSRQQAECPLLAGIADGSFTYFVHSYYVEPTQRSLIALEADYGGPFAAMVWRGKLFATQFHPEKSQAIGLQFLKNFLDM